MDLLLLHRFYNSKKNNPHINHYDLTREELIKVITTIL